MRKGGWFKDSYRHYLAAKGISTNRYMAGRTWVGSLSKYEGTYFGNLAGRVTRNVQRAEADRERRLGSGVAPEQIQQRAVIGATDIIAQPMSAEEQQVAAAFQQSEINRLQAIEQQQRAARLAYQTELRRVGLGARREREQEIRTTAEKQAAEKIRIEKVRTEEERKRQEIAEQARQERMRSSQYREVPPGVEDYIGRRVQAKKEEFAQAHGDFLSKEEQRIAVAKQSLATGEESLINRAISGQGYDYEQESKLRRLAAEIAVLEFAKEKAAKGKLPVNEYASLERSFTRIDPKQYVDAYRGADYPELKRRVEEASQSVPMTLARAGVKK